jgi:arylformamidase
MREIDVEAYGRAAQPETALREALSDLAQELAKSGAAPFHLTAMTWAAPDIEAVHPRRHAVDRIYREVFAGFRPPITLLRGDGRRLVARAHATIPASPQPAQPLWHGLSLPALAAQYSPRGQVPDMQAAFRQWSADGARFRSAHGGLDIAYGNSAYESLDYYRPPGAQRPQGDSRPPLWVFIHGGYWQAADKDQHAQFTAGMLQSGYAVANLNYGLCPDVTLEQITGQIRNALAFLVREANGFGFDPGRIHLAGHSAGGHLAAMMAAEEAAPQVRSALLLSGLFDLTPLSFLPMSRLLGLGHAGAVERLSPIFRRPRRSARVGVAVGELESDEFKWQSAEIAGAWQADGHEVIAGKNHFTLLDDLVAGPLFKLARRIAGD